MSKNKKKAKKISKEEYLGLFSKNKKKSEDMRHMALKEALDVRKFEIELYWKRTGFFWAFITVIYTALFHVICKYVDCPCRYAFFKPVILSLATLGVFFSVAWHMVNKGSKFWQKNWEKHVSLLEKSEMGPLHDVYLNPRKTGSKWKPVEEYDFSVSKVNMWASSVVVILSICCFVWTMNFLSLKITKNLPNWVFIILIVILLRICLTFFLQGNSNVEVVEDNKDDEIDMIHVE